MKKINAQLGDVFMIRVSDDKVCYGQIVSDGLFKRCAIFDYSGSETVEIERIIRKKIALIAYVTDQCFRNGKWLIVSNYRLYHRIKAPLFIVGASDSVQVRDEKGSVVRVASSRDKRIYSYFRTPNPMFFETTIRAYFGLGKWSDEHMDSMLYRSGLRKFISLFKKRGDDLDLEIRQIASPITRQQLKPLDKRCGVVQFNSPLTESDHKKLSAFMKKYPEVLFRVYGDSAADLGFLKYYPFVEKFQIDCYGLASIDGFKYLSRELEYFGFGPTKQNFSLEFLSRFEGVKELYLEGHNKEIETISKLSNLERLTLRSITLPDLSILLPLKNLWWLAIKLGGTNDLSLLPKLKLKYLELWMVKGLYGISSISELTTIQYLFLQDLKNITKLPDLSKCMDLRRVEIDALKSLSDLSPLLTAKNLEELIITTAMNLSPDDFKCLTNRPPFKIFRAGLGSEKKNEEVKNLINLNSTDESSGFKYKFQ